MPGSRHFKITLYGGTPRAGAAMLAPRVADAMFSGAGVGAAILGLETRAFRGNEPRPSPRLLHVPAPCPAPALPPTHSHRAAGFGQAAISSAFAARARANTCV